MADSSRAAPRIRDASTACLHRRDFARYTLIFDRKRRLCRMAAAGIPVKGEPAAASWYHDPPKPNLPPGQDFAALDGRCASFKADPRVQDDEQVCDAWYGYFNGLLPDAKPHTKDHSFHKGFGFDKGHMMARSTIAFGPNGPAARASECDSFYYTNAVPQVAAFNRSSAESGHWRYAETYVEQMSSDGARILEFTGPIFDDGDPWLEAKNGATPTLLQIPRRFWKILAIERAVDQRRFCYPMILDACESVTALVEVLKAAQTPGIVTPELPDLPPPKLKWSSLSVLEGLTNLDLSGFAEFPEPAPAEEHITSVNQLEAQEPPRIA